MTFSILFFALVALMSVAAAIGVISSRIPVHSALFLLLHFVSLAVLYITLEAQFLAAIQVIIYAGGIVILILFVIMLIGSDKIETQTDEPRPWTPYIAIVLGIVLFGTITYSLQQSFSGVAAQSNIQGGIPEAVGLELFSRYILPLVLVAVLLLVALLGALLLARRSKLSEETKH
jgi:NADH-quinone oxidoreductase subunit J